MEKDLFDRLMRSLGETSRAMTDTTGELETHWVEVPAQVDVKAIRKSLRMTQEAFAATFGFSLSALRHWERGDRQPGRTARILLKVIAFSPATVLKATRER
jgi:putative transcriptional regulator